MVVVNILLSLLPCQYKARTDSQIVSMNIFQFLTCLTDDMTCLAAPSQSMNSSGKINTGTIHKKILSRHQKKGDLLSIYLFKGRYILSYITGGCWFAFFKKLKSELT